MQRIYPILLTLTLAIVLTGCPGEAPGPVAPSPEPVSPPPSPQETPPAAPVKPTVVEPSTAEAKQAVKLMTELSGKYELTPSGTVKSIIVDSSFLNAEAIECFAGQPDLETLQVLNYRELNDAMVEKLSGLKNLRNLRLTNAGITDAAVATIVASFPSLKTLDISSNTLLTDGALKEIAKLKDLEQLTMMYCSFSEFGMMDISSLPKLKSVDIRANMQVGNSGMGYLAELPSLKSLKHMSEAVDDFGMESLSKAKGLDALEIQDFRISDRAGEFIRKLESLSTLIIFRCQGFGSSGLLELKGMKLNRLTLRDLSAVDDTGMEAFRELSSLKRLYLRELNSVSDAGMMNLVYLKDLEVLSVWEVPISDGSLETISKLPNLRDLTLRSTNITDASLDLLLSMPKLEILAITDNGNVSASGLEKLKSSKKFKKLDVEALVPKR